MKAIDKAKSFLKKYRHAWVLSYFLIYMPWFVYLEKRTDVRHYMIHSQLIIIFRLLNILLSLICCGSYSLL